MMRVDAFTHFIPKPFADEMQKLAGNFADIGKRMREVPCIHDLDERRRVVGQFKDYSQILSYPMPPIENIVPADQTERLCKLINDGFADITAKHGDMFPGWVAQVSLASPEAAIREAERAVKQLGALGVQIYTNIKGKPLDAPEFAPFFAKMAELNKPIWIHPTRGANFPDYATESKSLYEIWWALGWSYETTAAMSRLVFSKTIDNNPGLKLIVHHFGGIAPMLEGRIGPGWDQIGARTSDADYQALKKSLKKPRPVDYFKESFYADTAVFGADAATVAGLAFYPTEKVLFASDCPFDPEKGTGYIRETLRILDGLNLPKDKQEAIFHGNLEKITGTKLAK
jgi:predicted TIM-barrel fold metal-dependent hydrolase